MRRGWLLAAVVVAGGCARSEHQASTARPGIPGATTVLAPTSPSVVDQMRIWTQANKSTLLGVKAELSSLDVDQNLAALGELRPDPVPVTAPLQRDCAKLVVDVHDGQHLPEAPDRVFAESLRVLLGEIDALAQPCAANGVAPPGLMKLRDPWRALLASQGL